MMDQTPTEMLAWHFLPANQTTRYKNPIRVEAGQTLRLPEGVQPILCEQGFHASLTVRDAPMPPMPPPKYAAPGRVALGRAGEELVAFVLQRAGYRVLVNHPLRGGDLTVSDAAGRSFTVEVKTARRNCQKTYCFTLVKYWRGRTRTDHRQARYVALVCVSPAGRATVFVVPSDEANVRAITISKYPRQYRGKWAHYRLDAQCLKF